MPTLEKQTLLIIDDDVEDCYLTQYIIEHDYPQLQVSVITHSQTVIDQLEALAVPPILVLLDLNMPHKSGLEVLQELRAHPRYASVPVAILTGSEDPRQIPQMAELNFVAYLSKPTNYTEMSLMLQRLVTPLLQ